MKILEHSLRTAVLAAVFATALLAASAAVQPPSAAAAAPCWKALLNDWYDGRIDKVYKVQCYRDALKHLPTDVQVYSSARDDIQRALAAAVAKASKEHVKNVGQVEVSPSSGGGGSGPSGDTGTSTLPAENTSSTTQTETTGASAGRDTGGDGPFGEALGKAADAADSVPLPLIILGALALLLIAAGAAGVVVRRMQARGPSA